MSSAWCCGHHAELMHNNPFKSGDERKLVLYCDLLLSACCEEA